MSAGSPVRGSYTANRKKRQVSSSKYPNFSQRSPEPDSPTLNQESKEHSHSDLKTKLEILLKHNSQLLNENAQLSELVNSLRIELDIRHRKEESDTARVNHQMGNVMV